MTEGLESIVKEPRPGLRILDTNVIVSNSDAVGLLSGNIHMVRGYEEAIENSEFAQIMLDYKKDPHDILIPYNVWDELDAIKSNHRKSDRIRESAKDAQASIRDILKNYERHVPDMPMLSSLDTEPNYAILDNGAKVFFVGIKNEEVKRLYQFSDRPKEDTKIILTALEFAKRNHYKKRILITDDIGAQGGAVLHGLSYQAFLFEEVKNPMQLYTGLVRKDLKYKEFVQIKNTNYLDLKKDEKFRIAPENLEHNQIVHFRKRKRKKVKNKWVYDSHYMVHDPDSDYLRDLNYYQEFYDFFSNYRFQNYGQKSESLTDEVATEILEILSVTKSINHRQYEKWRQQWMSKPKKSKLKKLTGQFKRRIISKHINSLPQKYHVFVDDNSRKFKQGLLTHNFSKQYIPRGQQQPFLDHVINPNLNVVSVDAGGGFGKTLWSLAAGLYFLHTGKYDKIVYAASQEVAEKSVGILPGRYDEKISAKVRPAYDSIHKILGDATLKNPNINSFIEKLKNEGKLEITVIADWKGRTFDRAFGVIDEAHFFTRDELGLAMGRFGYNSKLIVSSDIFQKNQNRRNVNIDPSRTGVAHMTELLRDCKDYAHLTADFDQIYRGRIPEMAGRLTGRSHDIKKKILQYHNGKKR